MKVHRFLLIPLFTAFLVLACGDDGSESGNYAPVIEDVAADPDTIGVSGSARVSCSASDQNNDILVYSWFADYGDFPISSSGSISFWRAPADTGTYSVTAVVSDGQLADSEAIEIVVIVLPNRPPTIQSVTADPQSTVPDGITELTCVADDPDGDSLIYDWTSAEGSFPEGNSGPVVQWQAPGSLGDYYIHVSVSDGEFSVADSVAVTVLEPPALN
jgi:hypothetical protein